MNISTSNCSVSCAYSLRSFSILSFHLCLCFASGLIHIMLLSKTNEDYELCVYALRNFSQPFDISHLLISNYPAQRPLLKHSVYESEKSFSHSHKTGKIIVLCLLIFIFLHNKQEYRKFLTELL
jgi:hypothetical protein